MLRAFGAKIGIHTNIYNSAIIYFPWNLTVGDYSSIGEEVYVYNLGKVYIGNEVTVSYRSHLCAGTHNYKSEAFELIKPEIHIEDNAWLCTDCFIGPGVEVRKGAIVGARAAVFKDVESMDIVGGNPARKIGSRSGSILNSEASA